MTFTDNEKRLLIVACTEEIQYFNRAKVVNIVGKASQKTEDLLYQASHELIQTYTDYRHRLTNNLKDKQSQPLYFDPKDYKSLIVLCKDHIQTIEKHIVVKKQFDGTVSEKTFPLVTEMMMHSRQFYVDQYIQLINKIKELLS